MQKKLYRILSVFFVLFFIILFTISFFACNTKWNSFYSEEEHIERIEKRTLEKFSEQLYSNELKDYDIFFVNSFNQTQKYFVVDLLFSENYWIHFIGFVSQGKEYRVFYPYRNGVEGRSKWGAVGGEAYHSEKLFHTDCYAYIGSNNVIYGWYAGINNNKITYSEKTIITDHEKYNKNIYSKNSFVY